MAEVDKGLLKKANLEKPVRFDKALKSYTTHANGRKSARSSQGRVWWNALCEAVEISEGTNEMRCEVFFPKGEDASGAIGMLPATLKGDDLSDWMGRQMQSAAVYFDGQVFQNGQRLNDVEPLVNDDFGVSLELEWSVGGTFTIYRNEVKVYQFHRVPDNWRFAIGGFGGRATLVDDGEDASNGRSKIVINKIAVKDLPNGDAHKLGSGSSEAYVQFELMDAGGRRRVTRTSAFANASTECAWEDTLMLTLPFGVNSGKLAVTVFDDDIHNPDDALGAALYAFTVAEGVVAVDKLLMKGYEHGAQGVVFPDFEASFAIEFRGVAA